METLKYLVEIQILSSALTLLAIIYFVFRKIKKGKKEKFEKRDN